MKQQILSSLSAAAIAWAAVSCEKEELKPTPKPVPPSTTETVITNGMRDGITALAPDSLGFVLFAPGKQTVHLIGDFNNWEATDASKMTKDGDRFWIKIGGLQAGKEYVCQYLIDGTLRIADPYSNKVSDPDNDRYITADVYPDLIAYPKGKTTQIASVVSTTGDGYEWKCDNFVIDNMNNAVIYELHLRDFTSEGTVKAAMEKIPYLKELGVSVVELMPINEFEGNDSWGYNPSFYFAADKAYGPSADYKRFIDECHAAGMAVVIDMVLNHSFGQSPMIRMYQSAACKPTADNPWYNPQSNFANPDAQWGADFNHESKYTRAFVDSVCSYWMKEYRVDGFRFDFTKGFSNTPYPAAGDNMWGSAYDAQRIANLRRIYTELKRRNPNAVMICEHLADNAEERELAAMGIYLWGNMNYGFNETTMGWGTNCDVSWMSYQQRGWNEPNLVAYMESHDEERLMYKNLQYGNATADKSYSAKRLATALDRMEAAAVVLMAMPGPKMIWQFGELGYDVSIDFNGRTGRKPVRWAYADDADRRDLYNVFAYMNKLRRTVPAFGTSTYTANLTKLQKTILLQHAEGSAAVATNFDVVEKAVEIAFDASGEWTDLFSGNVITVDETLKASELIEAGGYRLYMQAVPELP